MNVKKNIDIKNKEVTFIFNIEKEELTRKGYIEESIPLEIDIDKIINRIKEILKLKNNRTTLVYKDKVLDLLLVGYGFSKEGNNYVITLNFKILN